MKKLIVLLTLAGPALAGTITQTVTFSPNDLSFRELDGYTVIGLNGAISTMATGRPLLPMVNLNLAIPATAEIRSIAVVASEKIVLSGDYRIYPAQPPRPMLEGGEPGIGDRESGIGPNPESRVPNIPFVRPDVATYQQNAECPGRLAETVRSGARCGYRIAGLTVYPLQYNPVSGKLTLYTSLKLKVEYDEGVYSAPTITPGQAELAGADVRNMVLNRDQVTSFAPRIGARDGEVDYCIITPYRLVSTWTPIVALRRQQGLNCVVMPIETVYARYAGIDHPAQIRAFITDYWQNRGLKWVVLGGDSALVPPRYCYLPYSTYNVPADIYYSDLDWSWDSNHNGRYGEMTGDTIDLLGDVYVGRIPCDDTVQLKAWINKDTIYELHPDTTYLKKIFLPWEWLEPSIGYSGFLVNSNISNLMPPDWRKSVVGNCVPIQTADSINAGQHFMHFAGHGDYNVFGTSFSTTDVPRLNNTVSRKLTIINSIAGYCGEFDNQECLGEALINAANGGAVAAMLNARYGWGAPPNMGPGEHFSQEFYRQWSENREIGRAMTAVKGYFRNVAMSQMIYRWTEYVLTSFMDPAMPMWTRPPQTMTVAAPESVPGTPQTIHIAAACGDAPLTDAAISLLNHNTLIATGRTNSQGWVELYLNPEGIDTLQLYATARDFLPYHAAIRVIADCIAPALCCEKASVTNPGHHLLNPGDTANLLVTLRNLGNARATAVKGVLSTTCPYVTILDSTSDYGAIAAGDTAHGGPYRVTVAADCPNGTRAEFWVRAAATEGVWQPFFELVIGPTPLQGAYWATHDTGDFILSVTGLGSIGSTGWRAEGLGMIWPKDYAWSATRLMLAGLILGTDTSYVCDRFYHPDYPANDSDFRMVDSVRPVIPPDRADEEYVTAFDDSPHRHSKNLRIGLHTYVLARPTNDDWAILEYDIENQGTTAVGPLAAGFFADFKMTGWNSNDSFDIAAAESACRMAYVYSGDTACLGVRLLYPFDLLGISAIDGYRYIQRPGMMSDAVKDSFLWGRKIVMNGPTDGNWACMVSGGPFTIPAGWHQRVVFAIVGGHSRVNLRANSDSAQAWYDNSTGAGEDRSPFTIHHSPFSVHPSVFRDNVIISYSLNPKSKIQNLKSERLTIDAFDPSGRLIEHVFNADVQSPGRVCWQPRGLNRGVYFLRVNSELAKVVRAE